MATLRLATLLPISILLGVSGCTRALEGTPCPCLDDYVCCPGTHTCHADIDACRAQEQCTANRVCADHQSICVEHAGETACEPLLDAALGCDHVHPPPEDLIGQDVMLFGSFTERASAVMEDASGASAAEGVEVAVSQINRVGGIPAGSGTQRKVLVVDCNENPRTPEELAQYDYSRDYLKARADHLTNTLHVPAIIGPSTSANAAILLAASMSDVIFISPTATDDNLTSLPPPRLGDNNPFQRFWRTTPRDSEQAAAVKHLIELVSHLHQAGDSSGRIATVADSDDAPSASILRPLLSELGLCGRSCKTFRFASSDHASIAELVEQLVAARPRVIVTPTEAFISLGILQSIERAWPLDHERPWYVLTDGVRMSDFGSLDWDTSDVADRVIGTSLEGARSSDSFETYTAAYQEFFGLTSYVHPSDRSEFGYDAMYLLAYAAAAALQSGDRSASSLAAALGQMSCKHDAIKIEAHRISYDDHITTVASSTESYTCFDFSGASGNLDYESHPNSISVREQQVLEPTSDVLLWCLEREQRVTKSLRYHFEHQSKSIMPHNPALALGAPGWCAAAPARSPVVP